jgi:predicted N-acetyltransferase YhbS
MTDMPAPPSNLVIADVLDHPQHIPILARALKSTFAVNRPHVTAATYEERLRSEALGQPLPRTWVALVDGEPAGCARLVAADHPARPDLTPWLASVFVSPVWRRRGIASALVQTVQQAAQAAGFPALYLFTEDQARLYARQGFVAFGTVARVDDGSPCDLMVWRPGQ